MTTNTCGLLTLPSIILHRQSTFQPSNEYGKRLIRVGNNLINLMFARIIYVSKIKKNWKSKVLKIEWCWLRIWAIVQLQGSHSPTLKWTWNLSFKIDSYPFITSIPEIDPLLPCIKIDLLYLSLISIHYSHLFLFYSSHLLDSTTDIHCLPATIATVAPYFIVIPEHNCILTDSLMHWGWYLFCFEDNVLSHLS